ncbi:MAG: hypothetical protein IJ072_04130, partial [Oscillospiraceae bacterium]|nr:hypothetical protein [Oscillospiraceae bacterium]
MVNLKKIKPIGVFMILFFSALVVIMCFVVDFDMPEKYTPAHDRQYYTESVQHMDELVAELEEHEFSRLEGIHSYGVTQDGQMISITVESKSYNNVKGILERDFGTG